MKHLIDEREPITLVDIDQAVADGCAWLKADDAALERIDPEDLIKRLLAIVENAYGGPQ